MTDKTPATVADLGELHSLLVQELKKRLREEECPASLFKEAREFLKDNNITAAIERSSDMKELLQSTFSEEQLEQMMEDSPYNH